MKSDRDIKHAVEAELKSDWEVDDRDIAVTVNDAVVTLSGSVRSLFQRHEAARSARRVHDVTAVANEIAVRLCDDGKRTDREIAYDIVAGLKLWLPRSWGNIKPLVQDGHVVLEGSVEWQQQRERAEDVARGVKGVASVGNSIRVVPLVAADNIKLRIEDTFRRDAEVAASRVAVNANGTEVTLRGRVRSWGEREQAQRSAWSAPGVTKVTNNLRVRPSPQ
jgi:osmotically-inducible protein OsmY